jgi:hypothetical protein
MITQTVGNDWMDARLVTPVLRLAWVVGDFHDSYSMVVEIDLLYFTLLYYYIFRRFSD